MRQDTAHRKKKESDKITFEKPGNMLYPVPAVLVSCADASGRPNVLTIAWTGTVCSDPPMVSISVRKSRYSHDIIRDTREFVVNLTTKALVRAADYCGVRSGRDTDKFADCHLTPGKSTKVKAPLIAESPVNLECRVTQMLELGSHDMFLAEVVAVDVDSRYMDSAGRFHLERAGLVAYNHGSYCELGSVLGTFGFSVSKNNGKKRR